MRRTQLSSPVVVADGLQIVFHHTPRSSSPLKASRDVDNSMMSMQQDNTMLQMQMGEKDVEMERMTTTLTALNGKLTVLNDIRSDIDQHKEYLENSE